MSKHHKQGISKFVYLFVGASLVLQGFSLAQPAYGLVGGPHVPNQMLEGGPGSEHNFNPAACGNGVKESGEQCDGADLGGAACTPEYEAGILVCTAQCTFDFSQCTNDPAPVCGNGSVEQGEQCDDGQLNGQPHSCNETCSGITPFEPVTLVAHKIICENETYLPNWGEVGMPDITGATAADFVAASDGHCWLAPDWTFQYGFGDKENVFGVDKMTGAHIGEADGTDSTGLCTAPYCGPNTFTGAGYSNWKTFGPTDNDGTTSVSIADLEDATLIWVRENLKEGYIPFTYPPQNSTENNISAEIYCGTDTLNYDNYDYVSGFAYGGTYHCVAFNAPIQSQEESFCGDGTVNEGEQCDDGNEVNDDTCSNECQMVVPQGPVCGNSTVEEGEQCDDGNTTNEDGCSATCQNEGGEGEEPFCGDATVDEGEQCDDGNDVNDDTCSNQCLLNESEGPACGNTVVEQGEQCDDGNTTAGDGCNSSCQTETPPGGGGSTGSASSGGGGGGGGGAILGLTIFNEQTLSVTLPTGLVSWFTNLPATTRVIYDTVSHDGTASGPNYGYAFSTEHDANKVTYHTVTLTGLTPGVRYYWRAVSSASPEKLGIEVSFIASENPTVLGFQDSGSSGAPSGTSGDENVKVLGFEHLPDTGGDLKRYVIVVTMLAALILTLTGLGYLLTLRKNL